MTTAKNSALALPRTRLAACHGAGTAVDWQTAAALGFRATLATPEQYLEIVAKTIAARETVTVFHHNLHSLYLYFRHQQVRDAYRYDPVVIDGMPVAWLLRLAGHPARGAHRLGWMDFFWPLMERATARRWRVFYVGHTEATLATGLAAVRERLPGLRIAGHHGFFDATPGSRDTEEVLDAINAFAADVCLVGMGMPRQELWVAAHRERIDAPAVLTCGACLEYIAGELSIPPRWLGRCGLEWAYRLAVRPRRLARRYLVEPWLLMALMTRYNLRHRRNDSMRDGTGPVIADNADDATGTITIPEDPRS